MDAKTHLAELCVNLAFQIGHIDQLLANKHITEEFFANPKFHNFLNEMLIEARGGKIAALSLNFTALRDALLQQLAKNHKDELKEAIDDAVWHCNRAIDDLYAYDNVNSNNFNLFRDNLDD